MKERILFLALTTIWIIAISTLNEIQAQQTQLTLTDKALDSPIDLLNKDLMAFSNRSDFNGFSVSIVNQKEILHQRGFGYSNVEKKREYTHNTIQAVASISKTLIGIALLKAQEQGKLKLDDPINKYLPFKVINPYYPDTPITIRHLATHTSSIKYTKAYERRSYVLLNKSDKSVRALRWFDEKFNVPADQVTLKDYLKNILVKKEAWYRKKNYYKHKPGTKFSYSNEGAALAAYVIEQATGESYDIYTKKYILQPLGMTSTGWSFDKVDMENLSMLYSNKTPLPKYYLIPYPDGGMITSVHDLGKFLIELIKGYSGEGTLLKPESYKEYFKEQLTEKELGSDRWNNKFNDEYNTGIFMGFTTNYIGHTGSDPGTRAYMFFDPKTRIGKIAIFNTSGIYTKLDELWEILSKYEKRIIR
jgi:CubicO group peptidase (beta-lactamase class C family)